ncbi:MAG: hypothetical protein MJA31_00300, partial [Clostridia bacterium]|nr:hypothetical protein [Clostridia bacterium]
MCILKKVILALMAVFLMFPITASYAATDGSFPKLIVEDYAVDSAKLTPGDTAKITVYIRNTHSSRSVRNIRLSFDDSTNEILPVKTASTIFAYTSPGDVFEWEIEVFASETAKDAPHTLNIKMEYED